MAIYHQTTKIVKRSAGRTVVAAAAYRSGSELTDETTDITHDYRAKEGVAHSEILAPDHAPSWMLDRAALWNAVEAAEIRKDAQLAREVEVGLPVELSKDQQVELLRDFVKREFVKRGMVADFSLHLDNPDNPHAHILLSTRHVTREGFGPKAREWNQTAELMGWRRGWAEVTNEHLAQAGLGIRIDHRSYAKQGIQLLPGRKIGVGQSRREDGRLPSFLADRVAEQERIARANGHDIIAEPGIALKALTRQQATFTHHDLGRFLHTRTQGAEQFEAAYLKVTTSREVVALGVDDQGRQRFTTRDMLGLERGMLADAATLAERPGHRISRGIEETKEGGIRLTEEQRRAVDQITAEGDLKVLVGVAGSGKSTAIAAMREAWEREGYTVKGAALAGIAAENLKVASGIESRTLASYELAWSGGRDPLTRNDVLVIDEAGMVGTRQLARVLEAAREHQAKVVLVGDPEQLQAIEAGAAFRGIAAEHGMASLSEVRRQRQAWQRVATAELSRGETGKALAAYQEERAVVQVEHRAEARSALLARWARDHKAEPLGSQLVLAYTRDEVKALNESIRTLRQQNGELGRSEEIATPLGAREFSVHDRIRFGRNEKALGVKNGSLGTVERVEGKLLTVRLDGAEKPLTVDTKFYDTLDHGYAATVHKAQGVTVDRTYVLATSHFDRHTTYVALSRHREAATVYYGAEDFGRKTWASESEVQMNFVSRLSRERSKDLAHDYLEWPTAVESEGLLAMTPATPTPKRDRFAGLKLKTRTLEQGKTAAPQTPLARRNAEFIRALDGFARAYGDMERMREKKLPILEHQRAQFTQAVKELERLKPQIGLDLMESIRHEPATREALRKPPGMERSNDLLRALEHEKRVRENPTFKAERLVKVWQNLEGEHNELWSDRDRAKREKVEERLQRLTREIKADPGLQRLVLERARSLGLQRESRLESVIQEKNLNRALSLSLGRGLERDHGLSL